MRHLTRKEDPTGFLDLFRFAAAERFGDPSGYVQGHGRYASHTKRGPGRRHEDGADEQAKQRGAERRLAYTRNPHKVVREHGVQFIRGFRDRVELLPVRMKLPRLRRCVR